MFDCAPILLINFNRPDFSARQIDILRQVKPRRIFFAVDGARDGRQGEAELCQATRDVAKRIDWQCEVKTLFHQKNLGCRHAPPAAIDWFFSHVDAGIILEDDCSPTLSFLRFASELLERYKSDERIGAISGFNRYNLQTSRQDSYHFNRHLDIWGWATWRRVWKFYDSDMTPYWENRKEAVGKGLMTRRGRKTFLSGVDSVARGLQTWDYQLGLMFISRGYLAAVPSSKLVCNQGIKNANATNTAGYNFDNRHIISCPNEIDFPLTHPQTIAADERKMLAEERREFAILPRGLTWLGCKMPFLIPALDFFGHWLEDIAPSLFRL